MIITKSIHRVCHERFRYDEIWAIVRTLNAQRIPMVPVPELAPDGDLFRWYQNQVNIGRWNRLVFNDIYKPRFLKYIASSKEAQRVLTELEFLDRDGKIIVLVCHCPDPSICHRSLVANLLIERGCNVVIQ